jgi:DNA-binding LacI/PurR family transcriptional regulator
MTPRGARISRQAVARIAGVSLSTAAHALNNHPRVAAHTRARIAEIAMQLGYTPNHAARRLIRCRYAGRNASFDQVGFICITSTNQWGSTRLAPAYWTMVDGAEQELFQHGASLTLVRIIQPAHWEKVARLVQAGGVDGWLVTGFVDDEVVARLREWKQRFVILGDRYCTEPVPVPVADVDEPAVGRIAVEYLAGLGHRRIARVGGEVRYPYQRDSLAGHRAAVVELGLDPDERLIVQSIEFDDQDPNPGTKRLEQLLAEEPTAIVVSEPGTTQRMLLMLRELGRKVPDDISVVGCEEQSSAHKMPAATRLELPYVDMGREAASLLRRLVIDPSKTPTEQKLGPKLVEGWSTATVSAPRHKAGSPN